MLTFKDLESKSEHIKNCSELQSLFISLNFSKNPVILECRKQVNNLIFAKKEKKTFNHTNLHFKRFQSSFNL